MEATKKVNGKSVKKWLSENAIIVLMLLVSLIVGIIHPNFFALANIINLFKNVSIRYIIALGISGCLITTGNDLSAGRLAGFAACLACIFAQTEGAAGKFYPNMHTMATPVVFILVIAICAIVGLCNGLVVSYLKVQPFIATLGMQQVVYGICLVYTGGTPIGSLNKNFTSLASNTIIGIPVLIWIALVVAACFWFLYNKTRHGKYMYAIGGNEAAAEVAGVNVNATKIRIYILASCMFGLAGCLLAAKSGGASVNTAQGYELDAIAACTIGPIPFLAIFALIVGLFFWFLYNKTRHGKYMYAIGGNENAAQVAGVNVTASLIRIYILASCMYALGGFLVGAKAGGASTNTGNGYELEAIAACTIGGVSTNGGVGKVSGVLVGVLVFEVLKICLQFLGVDPAYTYIAQGLVIVIAVALDLRKYLAKK